jgi:hypothetical protein
MAHRPTPCRALGTLALAAALALSAAAPAGAGPLNLPRAGGGTTHFDRNLPRPGVAGGSFFELMPALGLGPIIGAPLPAVNFGNGLGSFLDVRFPCPALSVPGVGSAEICKFSDFIFSPAATYHFEFEIWNPFGPTPTGYNVLFFTPEGVSGGRVRPMAAGEVYFFDVTSNDALVPFFPEVGGRLWWMFSRLPFPIAATSSITEGGAYPPPLFPCPVAAAGTTCGGVAGFSPPTTDMWDGAIDPALPSFAFFDPDDLATLLPLLATQTGDPSIPAPASLALLGAGLFGLAAGARWRRRRGPSAR